MAEFDRSHDPAVHQMDAGDVQQRVASLGGKEVFVDREGFLWHPEDWTEEVAAALAAECGIELLSDSQWRVVRFLQEYFLYNGRAPLNRDIKLGVGMSLMELECLFPEEFGKEQDELPACPIQKHARGKDMAKNPVYLDNAATTFPKPASALRRAVETYLRIGVSPGRGGYDLATEAQDLVSKTRQRLARFFNAPDPDRVIFTSNATDALNLALQGMVKPGDHVVSTRLEHNSVLRPLNHLRLKGIIDYDLVPFDGKGFVDPEDLAAGIRTNTRLVILSHASNVLGTIQPIEEIGHCCAEHGIPLLLDVAQTAGVIPIDMTSWGLAGIAFTGHKSMLGPTGIGGLVLNRDAEISPTRFGGTGADSKSLVHTETFPHRLEAGTLNFLGIIGLSESLDFIEKESMASIRQGEADLLKRLRDGLAGIDGITLYCGDDLTNHVGLLTLNVRGLDPQDVGDILDGDFGIAVRAGLHCAPLAHEDLGTAPHGSVRFSCGPFNTRADVDRAVKAMSEIAAALTRC